MLCCQIFRSLVRSKEFFLGTQLNEIKVYGIFSLRELFRVVFASCVTILMNFVNSKYAYFCWEKKEQL